MNDPRWHSDPVMTWLNDYNPRGVSLELWEDGLRDWVTACIAHLRTRETSRRGWSLGIPAAQRYARRLANLGAWGHQQGYPFDNEVLLDPAVVEYYCASDLKHDPSAATYRSDLRRLGPLLTKRAPWEPRPRPLPRSHIASPYSDQELEALWHVCDRQSTAANRRAAMGIYLLGLGAGLDGRWALKINVGDVQHRNGHLVVIVPAPKERVVPVTSEYDERLLKLVENAKAQDGADGSRLLGIRGRNKNALSSVVSQLDIPGSLPRLNGGRLRATWLRCHVESGTRIPELIQAAGLDGVTNLGQITEVIKTYPFTKYCEELRREKRWTFTS